MKRRLKLKEKVRYLLLIVITIIGIVILAIVRIKTIKKIVNKCDSQQGYTCDYYRISQYSKKNTTTLK